MRNVKIYLNVMTGRIGTIDAIKKTGGMLIKLGKVRNLSTVPFEAEYNSDYGYFIVTLPNSNPMTRKIQLTELQKQQREKYIVKQVIKLLHGKRTY